MRKTIGALITEKNKILLFRKNLTWILPGGKPGEGESDIKTLSREFKEEASGAEIEIGNYYNTYIGKAPHKEDIIESIVYHAKLRHPNKKLFPSNEIKEIRFIDYFHATKLNLSDIVRKVIKDLTKYK